MSKPMTLFQNKNYFCKAILSIRLTRLISIVSKPIKVVVVFVVVFAEKKKQKLGPKNFWSKIIHVQKTIGLKVLIPKKKLGWKKVRSQKLWVQNMKIKKNFVPK